MSRQTRTNSSMGDARPRRMAIHCVRVARINRCATCRVHHASPRIRQIARNNRTSRGCRQMAIEQLEYKHCWGDNRTHVGGYPPRRLGPRTPWRKLGRQWWICKRRGDGRVQRCRRIMRGRNWRNWGRWLGSSMGSRWSRRGNRSFARKRTLLSGNPKRERTESPHKRFFSGCKSQEGYADTRKKQIWRHSDRNLPVLRNKRK